MTEMAGSRREWHGGPIECRPSGLKQYGLLLLCALMLAGSGVCATLPGLREQIAGWAGLVVFGFGTVVLIIHVVRGQSPVVFGPDGVDDPRLACGPIAWADVTGLRVVSVSGTRLLCVDVADPAVYFDRMPTWKRAAARANAAIGFSPFTVGFVGLAPGIREVMTLLDERLLTVASRPEASAPETTGPA